MKEYLGDAVYVDIVHGMVCLTTEYGQGPTNTVYLEPEVMERLLAYLNRRSNGRKEEATKEG